MWINYNPDSLLEGIVTVNRAKQAAERALYINATRKALKIKFKKQYANSKTDLERSLMNALGRNASGLELSADELANLILTANNQAFRSPMNSQTFHYGVTYYNSTEHALNISNMGILDIQGRPIDCVAPGGLVTIPHHFTIGGNLSVVVTNAPQLRPVPTKLEARDRTLDIQPQSYVEWINFYEYNHSHCCNRHTLWSDKNQRLYCSKCQGPVIV